MQLWGGILTDATPRSVFLFRVVHKAESREEHHGRDPDKLELAFRFLRILCRNRVCREDVARHERKHHGENEASRDHSDASDFCERSEKACPADKPDHGPEVDRQPFHGHFVYEGQYDGTEDNEHHKSDATKPESDFLKHLVSPK